MHTPAEAQAAGASIIPKYEACIHDIIIIVYKNEHLLYITLRLRPVLLKWDTPGSVQLLGLGNKFVNTTTISRYYQLCIIAPA